jgi:hypothetical protein
MGSSNGMTRAVEGSSNENAELAAVMQPIRASSDKKLS